MTGTVSGVRDPAGGTMALAVQAVADDAAGVRAARVLLDGRTADAAPFGAAGCAAGACPDAGIARLAVDTRAVADGLHRLAVLVEDGNGAETTLLDQAITVANVVAPLPSTVELTFGSGSPPPGTPPTVGGGEPGAPGTTPVACRALRLTVELDARRPEVRRGAVVLRRDKRHRFEGRLTCRRDGRRRAAPRGSDIAIRRPGGMPSRTVDADADGRFAVRVRLERSGVIVFSARDAAGERVQVRIAVRVRRSGR